MEAIKQSEHLYPLAAQTNRSDRFADKNGRDSVFSSRRTDSQGICGAGEEMNTKPRLLDAFCGAGGAGMGYYQAGFEVVGVDVRPQKHYPFEFHQADALKFIAEYGREFDVIHASPICKSFTKLQRIHGRNYPDQITPIRDLLKKIDRPYIIENVPGSPLINPIKLNGAMFDLGVRRERWFETNPVIWFPPLVGYQNGKVGKRGEYDRGNNGLITVAGHNFNPKIARLAMDIDWMTGMELSQAIPPAYTKWIGERFMEILK